MGAWVLASVLIAHLVDGYAISQPAAAEDRSDVIPLRRIQPLGVLHSATPNHQRPLTVGGGGSGYQAFRPPPITNRYGVDKYDYNPDVGTYSAEDTDDSSVGIEPRGKPKDQVDDLDIDTEGGAGGVVGSSPSGGTAEQAFLSDLGTYTQYKSSNSFNIEGPHQLETINTRSFHKEVSPFETTAFHDRYGHHDHDEQHAEVHYHQHKHIHKHAHKQEHHHKHKQDHKHEHGHKHEHKQQHDHKHHQDHKHDHHHKHEHGHKNEHKHDHHHGHKHDHHHGHKHEHKHHQDHKHDHHHGHKHDHHQEHKHDHHHGHKHEHHHGHKEEHKHKHKHEHKEEHKHKHEHKHEGKHHHHKHHKHAATAYSYSSGGSPYYF